MRREEGEEDSHDASAAQSQEILSPNEDDIVSSQMSVPQQTSQSDRECVHLVLVIDTRGLL